MSSQIEIRLMITVQCNAHPCERALVPDPYASFGEAQRRYPSAAHGTNAIAPSASITTVLPMSLIFCKDPRRRVAAAVS
jgi:hypothetical protein